MDELTGARRRSLFAAAGTTTAAAAALTHECFDGRFDDPEPKDYLSLPIALAWRCFPAEPKKSIKSTIVEVLR